MSNGYIFRNIRIEGGLIFWEEAHSAPILRWSSCSKPIAQISQSRYQRELTDAIAAYHKTGPSPTASGRTPPWP